MSNFCFFEIQKSDLLVYIRWTHQKIPLKIMGLGAFDRGFRPTEGLGGGSTADLGPSRV